MIESCVHTKQTRPDVTSPSDKNAKPYESCDKYIADKNEEKQDLHKYQIIHEWISATNMVGLFTVSAFMGICAIIIGDSSKPFLNVFVSASEIFLLMASWSLRLAPMGIMFNMAGLVIGHSFVHNLSPALLRFLLLSTLAQLIQSFLVFPAFYFVMTRKSPLKLYIRIAPVIATAFGTSSSTGTIPMTIKTLEDIARLDPRVVRLMIPIMAIMNASGTIIRISSGLTFLIVRHSGTHGFELELYIIFITYVMSISANTGLPIVAGLASIPVILQVLQMDNNIASDLLPVLWILDPLVTVTNVLGDCVCAAVINHKGRNKLRFLHEVEEKAIKEMELTEANQLWGEIKTAQPPSAENIVPPVINHLDMTDM